MPAGTIVADVILDHFEGSTDGVPQGAVGYQAGMPGLGDSVDLGLGSYIQYGVPSTLENQGTIEMWLKPSTTPAGIMNFNWTDSTSNPAGGHVLHFGRESGSETSIGGWS
jgi:hypothetical protein